MNAPASREKVRSPLRAALLPLALLALAAPLAAQDDSASSLAAAPRPGCCWQPKACRQPVEIVYTAGNPDAFALPEDPASPRQQLADFVQQSNGHLGGFDSVNANQQLAHTFANLPLDVSAAQLEISLRANAGDITDNDALHLDWLGNVFAWGTYLGSGNPEPGLHPTPWSPGTAAIFHLNLAALPARDNKLSCILPTINLDHALDLWVQDDTGVDYAKLTIRTCKCDRKRFTVPLAGKKDAYAAPADPTFRSPALDSLRSGPYGWKDFDDPTNNMGVGYTFTSLPPGIVEATLKIAMAPDYGKSFDPTDAIHLEPRTSPGSMALTWGHSIPALNIPGGVLTLELDNLPGGGTNLLGELADGALDVYIQDDTNVDWMELTVLSCASVPWRGPIVDPIDWDTPIGVFTRR